MMDKFNIWDQDTGWGEEDSKSYKFLAKIKGTNHYFVTDYFKNSKQVEDKIIDSVAVCRIDETGMEIK